MVIQRESLSDSIVARIKDLILAGALKPGDRLPTENELALQFGVSRISVREATKALRFLGIIHSRQKSGLTVGQLDLAKLSECLDFHAIVSQYPNEQLLSSRIAIEVGILPLVAKKMAQDPDIYARLYAITTREGAISDPAVYLQADLDFHRELVAAANIEPLVVFSELLRTFFTRFQKHVVGSSNADRKLGTSIHRGIIAALRDGDLQKAQTIVLKSFETYGKFQ
jgi:GntR family transcriptional repressor for pyruvate dehydrogenase complex